MTDHINQPGIGIREYHQLDDTHAHGFHQILLPLHGTLELTAGSEQARAGGMLGAVISNGMLHRFRCEDKSRFIVIDLPAGHAALHQSERTGKDRLNGFFTLSPALQHLIRFAECTLTENRYQDVRPMIVPLVSQIMQSDSFTHRDHNVAQLSRICAMIDDNLEHPLSYEYLARESGIGISRLIGLFRRWMDCTPADYIARARLNRGHALLMETENSIADISLAAGFSEQSSFTRGFKRQFGISPGAFRRSRRTPH